MTCPVGLLRGSAVPETGLLPVPLTRGIQMHPPSPCGGLPTPAPTCARWGCASAGRGGGVVCGVPVGHRSTRGRPRARGIASAPPPPPRAAVPRQVPRAPGAGPARVTHPWAPPTRGCLNARSDHMRTCAAPGGGQRAAAAAAAQKRCISRVGPGAGRVPSSPPPPPIPSHTPPPAVVSRSTTSVWGGGGGLGLGLRQRW